MSNEIKALGPGQGCAATLLDIHGKVQVVLFVWVADDRIFVVTPPAMAAKTAEALDHYLFSEKVAIEDVSREYALFVLAEETLFKRVQSEWHSLSSEHPGPRKAKFKITRRLKSKTLAVNQGLRVDRMRKAAGDAGRAIDKLLSFQLPQKKLQA